MNCKLELNPIVIGTNFRKNDKGSNVDPNLFKRLVGSIMYLNATRTTIMYAISLISRFMESPKDLDWQVGKIILRYVAKTTRYGILYSNTSNDSLVGYTGSDFLGSMNDRKSTLGYLFHLGLGVIS